MTESTELTIPRRTIIKGAAWSLPVILASRAVPMAAASTTHNTTARLKWDTWRSNYTDNGAGKIIGVRTGVQIQNDYWADDKRKNVSKPTSVVTVSITYPPGVVTNPSPGAAQLTGKDWALTGVVTNHDGSVTYTLLYDEPIQASASSTEANLVVPATAIAKASVIGICFADNAEAVTAPVKGSPIK